MAKKVSCYLLKSISRKIQSFVIIMEMALINVGEKIKSICNLSLLMMLKHIYTESLTSSKECKETFEDFVASSAASQVISSEAQILNLTSSNELQETFGDLVASPSALQVISSEAQILNNDLQETFGDLVASPSALQVISSEAQMFNLTSSNELQETMGDLVASPSALKVFSSEAQILNLTSSNEFKETLKDLVPSPAASHIISSEAQILNLASSNEYIESFDGLIASPAPSQVITSESQILNLTSSVESSFQEFITLPEMPKKISKAPVLKDQYMKNCLKCNVSTLDLPSHMELEHNWSIASSKSVVGVFNLRKPYKKIFSIKI
ncbi:uncharacterized protein LOC136089281 isoform X1 [Hydra vulgaris]|uniref:Uncharacterized protein LOC136089281 isoform X1 n=1 Tax=Hydra vulgaris TaxID=6087 RepID=A0ABM4DA68_HYDVU